jgi:protein involved in polysaccharide export with SLBB domain
VTVGVLGAVFNQNAHLYRPGRSIEDYLRAAGGMTRQADKGRMFVIRADGSVIGKSASSGLWGAGFNSLRLRPGDTIVVPDQLPKTPFVQGLKDWTTIFTQFALGVAALKVLRD